MSSVKGLTGVLVLSVGLTTMAAAAEAKQDTAVLAGGCFWCMQAPFEKTPGVTAVVAGYAGGAGANPTYQNYAANLPFAAAVAVIPVVIMVLYLMLVRRTGALENL